jgi:large subunit ribosomal protein L24
MKIKKGDTVTVRTGKDAGKTSTVTRAIPTKGKLLVENVNVHTKFIKKGEGRPGQQVKIESPVPVAKVMLVCPVCKKATRVGYSITKDGVKNRVCKKCGESVEKAHSKSDKKKK